MYFTTDKEIYKTDDTFEITALIYPKNGEKKIRLFKNLNNLKISFHSNTEDLGFSQELKKHFIEGPSLTEEESEYLDEFTISKTQPFKKTFKGIISETNEKIIFEIPELNISDSIKKSELLLNPKTTIKGNCHTVYSGIEENFTPKCKLPQNSAI
jgi:hypothetical protein